MKKIRLAIVGCGIAARDLHYPALKALNDKFEIVAVTSRTKKHAEEFAKLVGNPEVFDTYEELLEADYIDAVDLTLPIHLNVPFAIKAVEKGKHVICEKPISTDVESAKQLLNVSKETNKVIYIAENWRHIKKFRLIKNLLKNFKEVLYFNWRIFVGMKKDNKYAKTDWRKKPQHIGGFLSDAGVHHVAAMRLIFGDIDWVTAYTKDFSDYLSGPDFISTIVEFKNGVIGNYVASYSFNEEEQFEIYGKENTLKVLKNKIFYNEKEIDFEENMGYKEEFEDFYEVILNNKENDLGNCEEAIKDLAFFEAALKSNGNKIKVDALINWIVKC